MRDRDEPIWFYELHEGDNEVYSDVLLAHETEYDEAEFLELVLEARARVLDTFTQDTLSEAIAADLAARHGFIVVDDRRLRAAVNVSAEEGGTVVAEVVEGGAQLAHDDGEMRTLLVDLDKEDRRWGDA
jgi:hypothetical protein